MAKHNEIGKIGEDIASHWLKNHGYIIVDRNYTKKYGEIDIVARETNILHFIEVKTVSYETKSDLTYSVSHETWRPEENVHNEKLRRLKNTIIAWMFENKYTKAFQIDVLTVRLVPREKFAEIKVILNIIIE